MATETFSGLATSRARVSVPTMSKGLTMINTIATAMQRFYFNGQTFPHWTPAQTFTACRKVAGACMACNSPLTWGYLHVCV
jgi:hypothetical protein